MSNNDNGAGYTIKEIVVRLESKVDKVLDDHETRLRSLESDRNQRKGRAALVMSAIAFIAAAASVASVFLH